MEWDGWGVGGMSPFSHLSQAQMFGEMRWRIGGLRPEQGSRKKVKETTSEGELRGNQDAERRVDRPRDKGWRISTIQETDGEEA